MAGYGLDMTAHRSHRLTASDLLRADLTLTMARENLRAAVAEAPVVWPRAFTLRELVRCGGPVGRRSAEETLADWLARAHRGRQRSALLGESPDDDVADPIGGPQRWHGETARTLSGPVDQLVGSAGLAPGKPGPARLR